MKKTISIASLAISASASFALIGPMPPGSTVSKTYCVETYQEPDGSMWAGGCDESMNNTQANTTVKENGCAEGQIAITTSKMAAAERFPIEIRSCMPPNFAQL